MPLTLLAQVLFHERVQNNLLADSMARGCPGKLVGAAVKRTFKSPVFLVLVVRPEQLQYSLSIRPQTDLLNWYTYHLMIIFDDFENRSPSMLC